MKSIKTILLSSLFMAGVITSCTNEIEESIQTTDSYLKVEAVVDGITRGAIDATNFSEGASIGLFIRDMEGNAYSDEQNCSNIKATFDGGQWEIATKFPLYKDKEAVVYAYYPYNAYIKIVDDSIDIDITNQEDILYGSAKGVTYKNQTAKIQFNHALARVTLPITKGANDVGAGFVKSITLKNGPKFLKDHSGLIPNGTSDYISLKGRMNFIDGTIKRVTDVESVLSLTPRLTISETTQYVNALLIPCGSQINISSVVASVEIILNIDRYDYNKSISSPYWSRGIQYAYPITINRTKDYTRIPAEKIYMGFDGDNGKPLYWASYNLGASQPHEDGGYYGWGDPTGTHTEQWEEESYGNYVNMEDAIQYYGGVDSPSNISGTEYDIARAMWGDGWRIPSEDEWRMLTNNCSWNVETRNGIDGLLFRSKLNGNTLFMPLTNYREGTHVRAYGGYGGYYWTSTQWSEGTAYNKILPALIQEPDWSVWLSEKCMGYSIRPVTE